MTGPLIEGYASGFSYVAGETVSFACRTTSKTFSAEIARVGGTRDVIWHRRDIPGRWQDAPDDASSSGCNWEESFSFDIPVGQRSGYYEVVLRAHDEHDGRLAESLAFFVIRPDSERRAGMLLVLATNTYNAYNDWGGPSLYTGATRVSFRRPLARGFLKKPEPHLRYHSLPPHAGEPHYSARDEIDDPEHEHFRSWADVHGLARWSGSAGWHNWERVFVRWAELQGYEVDVAVNADLEFHPEVLESTRLVVSVGHDEYWSWAIRDSLENFVDKGGNAAFFSGNTSCWQVRFEDDGAAMVCFKAAYEDDPVFGTDRQHLLSTAWCSRLVERPEARLTGVSFSRGGYIRMGRAVPRASGGYTAWRPDHWVFAGTGLRYGDLFGAPSAIAAYEVDGCEFTLSDTDGLPVPTGRDGTPEGFTILATAPARLWSREELPSRYRPGEPGDLETFAHAVFGDESAEHLARLSHNHAVMGAFTRGGTVFTAATTDWAYGLANHDPEVERITRNVLDRLSSDQPAGSKT